jgi:hypothetical protein
MRSWHTPRSRRASGSQRGNGLSRWRATAAALAAFLAVGLAAGCGGSSSKSSGNRLSESAFIAQAHAIVCPAQDELESLTKPSGPAELGTYVAQASAIIDRIQTRLAALAPPANKEAAFKRGLSLIGEFRTKLTALSQAASAGEQAKVESIARGFSTYESSLKSVGHEIGGEECPTSSSSTSSGSETSTSSEAPSGTSETPANEEP